MTCNHSLAMSPAKSCPFVDYARTACYDSRELPSEEGVTGGVRRTTHPSLLPAMPDPPSETTVDR